MENNNNFTVFTFSEIMENPCYWYEGLHMVIEKEGISIRLNGDEIKQIVQSLPRTFGGQY